MGKITVGALALALLAGCDADGCPTAPDGSLYRIDFDYGPPILDGCASVGMESYLDGSIVPMACRLLEGTAEERGACGASAAYDCDLGEAGVMRVDATVAYTAEGAEGTAYVVWERQDGSWICEAEYRVTITVEE